MGRIFKKQTVIDLDAKIKYFGKPTDMRSHVTIVAVTTSGSTNVHNRDEIFQFARFSISLIMEMNSTLVSY